MSYLDGRIDFHLDNRFVIEQRENDNGEFISVKYNVTTDEKGEEKPEHAVTLKQTVFDDEKMKEFVRDIKIQNAFKGNMNNYLNANLNTMTIMMPVNIAMMMLFVRKDNILVMFGCSVMAVNSDIRDIMDEKMEVFSEIVNGTVIDGVKVALEGMDGETMYHYITSDAGEVADETDSVDVGAEGGNLNAFQADDDSLNYEIVFGNVADAEFPYAKPGENQHEQLDFQNKSRQTFGMLGNMVQLNASGTEYAFNEIVGFGPEGADENLIEQIHGAAKPFPLAEEAKRMARVFRVTEDTFNPQEDREQEILQHFIRRAYMFDGLRSFAWTLGAYCDKNNLKAEDVDLQTLREIADFVADRKYLNYEEGSFCPTLCAGNDFNVLFVPDAFCNDGVYQQLLNDAEGTADALQMQSLDGLRKDLEFLYPAMKLVHDDFAAYRDRSTALEGTLEDVLYAWCSTAYAADTPIYSDDGPVNCDYLYPEDGDDVQVNLPKKERPQPDLSKMEYIKLTYDEGNKFENEKYTMLIPDGFKIKEGAEGRDFIAYLPNPDGEDEYLESNFVIYAGKELRDIPEQFNTPEWFAFFGELQLSMMPTLDAGDKTKNVPYLRREMPGSINFMFDRTGRIGFRDNTINANISAAVAGKVKLMRIQINMVPIRFNDAYEKIVVKTVYDHMTPKEPVKLLPQIDGEKFMVPNPSKALIQELCDLTVSYIESYNGLKSVKVNSLVQNFQRKASPTEQDLEELKKNFQGVTDDTVHNLENELRACERVFRFYGENDVDSSLVETFRDAIVKVVAVCNDQELTVNGGEWSFVCKSEYAENLVNTLVTPAMLRAMEEEKKRREEEQRRKEEERLKKEEQKKQDEEKNKAIAAKYRAEMEAWSRECAAVNETIKQQSEAALAAETKALREAFESELQTLDNNYAAEKAALEAKIKELNETIANLGALKFSAKKAAREELAATQLALANKTAAYEKARAAMQEQEQYIPLRAQQNLKENNVVQQIQEANPVPERPTIEKVGFAVGLAYLSPVEQYGRICEFIVIAGGVHRIDYLEAISADANENIKAKEIINDLVNSKALKVVQDVFVQPTDKLLKAYENGLTENALVSCSEVLSDARLADAIAAYLEAKKTALKPEEMAKEIPACNGVAMEDITRAVNELVKQRRIKSGLALRSKHYYFSSKYSEADIPKLKNMPPTASESVNDKYKQAILRYAKDGMAFTISDLVDYVPELSGLTMQRIAALVRQLVEAGKLNRTEVKRIAYFTLAE